MRPEHRWKETDGTEFTAWRGGVQMKMRTDLEPRNVAGSCVSAEILRLAEREEELVARVRELEAEVSKAYARGRQEGEAAGGKW